MLEINKINTQKVVKIVLKDPKNNVIQILGNQMFSSNNDEGWSVLMSARILAELINNFSNLPIRDIVNNVYPYLLPFAKVKRNIPYKFVYHGSNNKFAPANIKPYSREDYYSKQSNGTANGFGVYVTTNLQTALQYGQYLYIYTVPKDVTKYFLPLSSSKITLKREQVENLITAIQESDNEFLTNYGDIDYEGYEPVFNEAVSDTIDSSKSDIDIISGLIYSGADQPTIFKWLNKNYYGYSINHEFPDQITILNTDMLNAYPHTTNPVPINFK